MIDYTQALAKTALLPERPQEVVQRGGGAASQGFKSPIPGEEYFGIPKAPEGLQYTDKLAQDSMALFKKRQDLINYAKSMWTANKIDVTNPDPYNPSAVLAAEAFKMELGNFLSAVDRSKEGQKTYQDLLKLAAQNKFTLDPRTNSQYASELAYGEGGLGYSNEIAPELEFTAKGVNRSFDTSADYKNAQQDAAMMTQKYNDPNASGPAGIQARAAQSLNPMMNIQSDSGGGAGKTAGVYDFVSRFVNHKNGGGNWQVSKTYTEGGEVWRESTDYAGTKVGKRTVKGKDGKETDLEAVVAKTVRNPKTGEVKFVFTNGAIPPEPISGVAANQALEKMAANNPKYPSVEKINAYLQSQPGSVDSEGVIVDDVFVSEATRKKAAQGDEEAGKVTTNTTQVVDSLNEPWKFLGLIPWGKKPKNFDTKYGKVTIEVDGDVFTLTDPKGKDTEYPLAQLNQILRAYEIDMGGQPTSDIDPDI